MQRRILIVEDDADLRRALTTRLRAAGYDVTNASDGPSALESARGLPPDLVLLDLGLPAGDGYSVMDRIRRTGELKHVPIVVLSASDPRTEEAKARARGAVAFLAKPADSQHLLRVIADHVWPPRTKAASAAKILVIEDDADTRAGLVIRLESHGFRVAEAWDGATAVAVGARELPDLVLLDLGLPAGDGFTVLQRLKSHGALSSVPVIVVSARDVATNRERALGAGAVAYFQKPADAAELLQAIRQALRER